MCLYIRVGWGGSQSLRRPCTESHGGSSNDECGLAGDAAVGRSVDQLGLPVLLPEGAVQNLARTCVCGVAIRRRASSSQAGPLVTSGVGAAPSDGREDLRLFKTGLGWERSGSARGGRFCRFELGSSPPCTNSRMSGFARLVPRGVVWHGAVRCRGVPRALRMCASRVGSVGCGQSQTLLAPADALSGILRASQSHAMPYGNWYLAQPFTRRAKCIGCEGCGGSAAAPAPQAHLTAPYWPRCSLDQRAAGRYLCGLGIPVDGLGSGLGIPVDGLGSLGLTGCHIARFPPRRVVVAEGRSGTLSGGLECSDCENVFFCRLTRVLNPAQDGA